MVAKLRLREDVEKQKYYLFYAEDNAMNYLIAQRRDDGTIQYIDWDIPDEDFGYYIERNNNGDVLESVGDEEQAQRYDSDDWDWDVFTTYRDITYDDPADWYGTED